MKWTQTKLGVGLRKNDLVRCATIIDCEGSIGIYRQSAPSGGRKFVQVWGSVQVTMTHPAFPKYLQECLGGRVSKCKESTRVGKPLWRWRIYAQEARTALSKLCPFLVVKRKQANLFIQYHKQVEQLSQRERLGFYKKSRKLNA